MSNTARQAWRQWWDEEGSAMRPLPNEDTEQFARRMTEIAWSNGAFKRLADVEYLCLNRVGLERELAAAIKQRDHATAWRPIESAPMDGTVVMLYGDGRVTCGSWIAEQDITVSDHVGCYPSGETTPAYWQSHDGGFTEAYPATHWMPLPQPPREQEGGGA